ncbi:MAG: hypothetical protein H7288_17215 [Kineosporiaceae bacterium]|nr:hypothetical protein [Aeromicrobium sp.]
MSELQDLLIALDSVNREIEQQVAKLVRQAQQLNQAATQASAVTYASSRAEGDRTAIALKFAQRAVSQAAQHLHQAALAGKSFVARHGGTKGGGGEAGASPVFAVGGANPATADALPAAHTLPGLPAGCQMIPVSMIDQSENPINGPEDFGKGYSIEDLNYAFDLLEGQILPNLANGADASSFSERDRARGIYGTRSLADTYSGFLDRWSGNVIKLELRPDGTYGITNGRHRVYVAAQGGRQFVPAFIS